MESKTNKPSQRKLCYCKWQSNEMGKIRTQPSINKRVSSNSNSGNKNNNNKNCHNAIQWENTKWSGKEWEVRNRELGCTQYVSTACMCDVNMGRGYIHSKKNYKSNNNSDNQRKCGYWMSLVRAHSRSVWSEAISIAFEGVCVALMQNSFIVANKKTQKQCTSHSILDIGIGIDVKSKTATCINDSWCSGVVCRLQD